MNMFKVISNCFSLFYGIQTLTDPIYWDLFIQLVSIIPSHWGWMNDWRQFPGPLSSSAWEAYLAAEPQEGPGIKEVTLRSQWSLWLEDGSSAAAVPGSLPHCCSSLDRTGTVQTGCRITNTQKIPTFYFIFHGWCRMKNTEIEEKGNGV